MREVTLNGRDITKDVLRVEIEREKGFLGKRITKIFYKSGGIYQTGEKDELHIIGIDPGKKCKIKRPKFKIGDYVVEKAAYNPYGKNEFIKIFSILERRGKYIYNIFYGDKGYRNWLIEDQLRSPNKDELDLYFR